MKLYKDHTSKWLGLRLMFKSLWVNGKTLEIKGKQIMFLNWMIRISYVVYTIICETFLNIVVLGLWISLIILSYQGMNVAKWYHDILGAVKNQNDASSVHMLKYCSLKHARLVLG